MKLLISQHKFQTFIMVLLLIVAAAMDIYAGVTLNSFYDILTSKVLKHAVITGCYIICIHLISVLVSFFAARFQASLLKKYNMSLRNQVLKKITGMEYSEFILKQPGEYASWLISDINLIETNSILPFFNLIQAISSGIFSVIALAYMHYSILILSVISGILLTIVPKIFVEIMKKSAYEQSVKGENLFQTVSSLLSGFEIFLTYNRKKIISKKLEAPCLSLELEKEKFNKKKALMDMLNLAVFRLFEMSVMVFTALLAFMGIVDMGAIFSIGNIGNRFFNSVSDTLTNWTLMNSSGKIFTKFTKTKDSSLPLDNNASFSNPTLQKGISIVNLSVKYGSKIVFEHKDFSFHIKEKYAIIGESGSGKSTLMKCIMGMHKDYTGNIFFDCKDIRDLNSDSIYSHFAYIGQNNYIFNDTIRFNLALDRPYPDNILYDVLEKVNLSDFVKNLPEALDTILDNEGSNISGGQKQRICIARAILQNKTFFLVDEGTSALDSKNATLIEELLLKNNEYTVIFITHNLPKEKHLFSQIYKL